MQGHQQYRANKKKKSWLINAAKNSFCTKPAILFSYVFNSSSCSLAKEQANKPYQSAAKYYSREKFDPTIRKFEKAAKAYQAALETNPNQPDVIYQLAIVYKSQGKIKEAISEFKKVLRINKDFVAARIVLGDLYVVQNEKAKARKEYTTLIDMKPFGLI